MAVALSQSIIDLRCTKAMPSATMGDHAPPQVTLNSNQFLRQSICIILRDSLGQKFRSSDQGVGANELIRQVLPRVGHNEVTASEAAERPQVREAILGRLVAKRDAIAWRLRLLDAPP